MAGKRTDQAYVTLATNDTYAVGALVLGNSLRRVGTNRCLAVMVTSDISPGLRGRLCEVFDLVQQVDIMDSNDTANLQLLNRPDLGVTFTKLHCWRLTQFSKCVFMDADMLVLQNIDDLFEREELSAAPDVGWPDCFNSGLFVLTPCQATYDALVQFAVNQGSFDGGDQGLLNAFFHDWAHKDIKRHLPFVYNVVAQIFYTYLPSYKRFGKDVKAIHFIGTMKPWHCHYNSATHKAEPPSDQEHLQEFMQAWWNIFTDNVLPLLATAEDAGPTWSGYTKEMLADRNRQYEWEKGHVDYLGIDSFDNILGQLQSAMTGGK